MVAEDGVAPPHEAYEAPKYTGSLLRNERTGHVSYGQLL